MAASGHLLVVVASTGYSLEVEPDMYMYSAVWRPVPAVRRGMSTAGIGIRRSGPGPARCRREMESHGNTKAGVHNTLILFIYTCNPRSG